MSFSIRFIIAAAIAAIVGLGTTDYLLRSPPRLGTSTFGIWTAWPSTGLGTEDYASNPYLRARLARHGTLPLGLNEGVELEARTDSDGNNLVRHCNYKFTGNMPSALLWTLTVIDSENNILSGLIDRIGVSSDNLLRQTNGTFAIWLSRHIQPGNWLSLGSAAIEDLQTGRLGSISGERNQFVLKLRIYGANLLNETTDAKITFPSIEKSSCVKL